MANFRYYNHKNNDVGDWKRSKDETFHGCPKPRSYINRKPSSVNDRKLSAYQLEERFCKTVGGVSWKEVVQNQKYMYQHEKILEWKDSAVEDAFWNAKKRFLAKVHGRPCDVKLPDPDIFIDKIDWNSTIDPTLLSDLEKREPDSSCETEKQDGGVIIGIPPIIIPSDLTPNGWGDAEEVKPQLEETGFSNGWGEEFVCVTQYMARDQENKVNGSTWNGYRKRQDYGYGKRSEHGRHYNFNHGSNRKVDSGGWNTSRYKISRFQHNNYDQSFNNCGAGKGSFSYERPLFTWKPVTRGW